MSLINPLSGAASPQSTQSSPSQVQSNNAGTGSNQVSKESPVLDPMRLQTEQAVPEQKGQELTQEDFFALLSQQLSMQDPFKPVENDQMIAQMASFSTVDGIAKLNEEILNLNSTMTSSQALQASGLVGQKVLIPSGTGHVSAEDQQVKAVVTAPEQIEEITVRVEDDKGQLVTTFKVDGSAGGNIDFTWDGLNSKGEPVPEGNYSFKASGRVDGESQELAVSTYAHVTSVSLGSATTGAVLNLKGIGGVKLSDVLAVAES
ncbi:flagellar hook assembly protein FlgD [Shewanella corallii]|uniref:Basal-body rod modification protein FlgD n=1 Tax=Shewanella corallii TaxID=560080 RepID=A0ABT0N3S9_9GAMM|nr:flagellar hook assembly protein FlgD [Shewanella corallii]MCL2913109.1 flagellar hook assembly protein FlgD [Shewanella corallii]